MMGFLSAHGFDPGPSERPLLAGAATALVAAVPAGTVLAAFGTFQVVADLIMRLPRFATAAILLAAFVLAGMVYGALFRRAANDRDGGWIFGLTFGFLLWVAAPVVVLPLIGGPILAVGIAGLGFLVSFLAWGLTLGASFPFVHRLLSANLDGSSRGPVDTFGPEVASSSNLSRLRGMAERIAADG